MAGYTEQHLIDALISSMVDNSSYAVLAGEDMPMVMRQEMESSMSRLAEPIHDHIVSWATNSGSGGPPYEYNLGNPPFDGYILASTSDGVRYWTPPGTGGVVNETDPVFLASVAYGITSTQITNWDTAYGWGDHSSIGYELGLGNPTVDGYVLTSTTAGIRSWVSLPTGGGMVYPSAGIALSTGSSWGTSITDNSSNWNTAYGWGDHSGLYRPVAWVPTWDDVTNKPTAFTPINHGLVSSYHTVSGLTTGHFLRASGSTTYGFAALLDTDIKPLLNDWFELVGTAPNQYIRCKYPFAGDYDIQGYTDFDQFPPTIWESMPLATSTSVGGIQLGTLGTRFLREDGTWQTVSGGGGGTVITSGTPVDNQVAVFTNATTIEGHTGFTYNSSTGYVDVAGIVRASGNLQHLLLHAGAASGTGSDAGSVTIKAYSAIYEDYDSEPGAIYLVTGADYDGYIAAPVYLGNSSDATAYRSIETAGSSASISLGIFAKGSGNISIGTTSSSGQVSVKALGITVGSNLLRMTRMHTGITGIIIDGGTAVGTPTNIQAGHLTLRGGAGSATAGYDSGASVYIYGGSAQGSGTPGNIYFGTGSAGSLPVKSSETNIIYYDTATGKISYGAAPSGGSMVYPSAGIAVSTGSAWGTSITDNSTNWNTAYGWGNHAGLYSLVSHTHTGMVDYTGTPVNNQVAVFTDTNTIEGHTGFTYDSTTGYVNVAGIVRASGSLQHLTLQAGNASGAAGTDAGNITIKAGDAINADSGSTGGSLYLVPGNLYATGGSGIIYLGNSSSINTRTSFRAIGTPANINIEFIPKGDGGVIIGGYVTYIQGALSMGESIQINEGYRLLTPEILGRNGTGPLTIRAPGGYSGSPNGRDLRLYPGLAYTGGVNGNIYLGTGSAGYLPEKVSETDIIYYDSTTGKISYGAAPTSGTNYWQRSGTLITTATAGDDLQIDGDVWLNAAVYITSQFLDTPLGYMVENNNSNRLGIGTGLHLMVITNANRHKVPGVAAQTHPTLSVWSNADPEINANQYIAMTHNGTEGVIWSATGLVKIDDGLIVTGALTLSGLSSTATAYVLYYNSTTGAITYGDVPSGGSGITGTGLTGRIAYWTGASTVSYGSLYWNNANNSVGIGISPSSANLHVSGDDGVTIQSAAATGSQIRIINTSTTGDASILFYSNTSTAVGSVGWDYNTSSYFKINYGAITNTHITISSSGYVGIGGVPESLYALAVRGHMYMADTTILNTAPSTTTSSGFRIRHGTAPSSPTNGDVWTTTSGMYVRINGTTVGPLGTGGSGVTPVDSTLLDWSTDRYQPYAAAAAGAFDSGAVNPSGTTRLNYGGYLYATRLYSGGEQTITLSAAVNANRLAVYSGPTSVSSLATLYMVGDVLNAGYLFLGASNTTYASIRLPHGTAPTSPTNGDMWTTTSGIYVRINGTTVGPLGAGGGITGSGSSGRVTYWSGTSAVTSSANLTFDGSILTISNGIRLTAPATNQTGSGIRSSFTAGEALVFGNLVYMKNDGKVWKASASSITTTPVMGMCMGSVSADGTADILLSGRVYNTSWSLGTGGNVLYLGTYGGGFSSVAPSGVTGYVVQVIGIVLSATTIYFNPSLNRITLA